MQETCSVDVTNSVFDPGHASADMGLNRAELLARPRATGRATPCPGTSQAAKIVNAAKMHRPNVIVAPP